MREVVPTGSAVSATSEAPGLPAPERQSSPFVCPSGSGFSKMCRRPPSGREMPVVRRGPSETSMRDPWRLEALSVSALLLVAGVVVIALPLIERHARRMDPGAPAPRVLLAGEEVPLGPEGEEVAPPSCAGTPKGSLQVVLSRGEQSERRTIPRALLGPRSTGFASARCSPRLAILPEPLRAGAPPGAPLMLPIPVAIRRDVGLATLLKLKDETRSRAARCTVRPRDEAAVSRASPAFGSTSTGRSRGSMRPWSRERPRSRR